MDHMILILLSSLLLSSITIMAIDGLISVIEVLPKFLTPYLSDIVVKVVVMVMYCVYSCDRY